jgi:protein ImuA
MDTGVPQGKGEVAARESLEVLRGQLAQWESGRPQRDRAPISTGDAALDAWLPWGGLPRGALIECVGWEEAGGGAGLLALLLARQAARSDGESPSGELVVLDTQRRFYPPAAALWGVDLKRVLVIQATAQREQVWALDQCLRCSAVAAVWASLEQLDPRDYRRLQLAVEQGGGVGLLVRQRAARNEPSWADLQLLVRPRGPGQWGDGAKRGTGWRLEVEVTRCRQAVGVGSVLELEIDVVTGEMQTVSEPHETYGVYPTTQLVPAAFAGRSARA